MIETLKMYHGEAIVQGSKNYSFAELNAQVWEFSQTIKGRIHQGDVIIIYTDYSFKSIALLLALSQFPVIIVPVVTGNSSEFEVRLKASGANMIIQVDAEGLTFQETVNPRPTYKGYSEITASRHSGVVLFSSGTTGTPKVMVHDFTNMMNGFAPPKRQKNLRILIFLMFDHIGGLNTLLSCLNNGSVSVLTEDRNPENILSVIEKNQVQVLPTSPTFLNLMLQSDRFDAQKLSSLKLVTYGTERMPEALLKRLNQKMPGAKFLQTFGTSETGILKTVSKSSNSLFFKIINTDLDHRIVDNQLFLKTKTTIKGYKDHASGQFTEDGWFMTGDLVEQDEEGYIKIVGRINDVINVGGQKVLPVEVEKVINSIPQVIDATVYGENNAITGQIVCAKVVVSAEAELNEMKRKIKMACKESLDKYKCPVKIELSIQIETTDRYKKKR